MADIHPTAIVDPRARIAGDVGFEAMMFAGSVGSFSITVALMIPSSGVARRHSEVVTAGRLRFTIVIAQLANAVQTIPL